MWGGLNVSIFIPYIFWFLYCLTDHEREKRGHLQRWGPGQAPWGRGSCCEAWQHGSNRHTMSTQTFWPWTWSQTLEWWKTVTNNHKSQIIQHNTILFLDISSNQWNQGLFLPSKHHQCHPNAGQREPCYCKKRMKCLDLQQMQNKRYGMCQRYSGFPQIVLVVKQIFPLNLI